MGVQVVLQLFVLVTFEINHKLAWVIKVVTGTLRLQEKYEFVLYTIIEPIKWKAGRVKN